MTKDLKHLIYYRFNTGPVGKGPGCGFWAPGWRVWLFFMRGIVPLLERWLVTLLYAQAYLMRTSVDYSGLVIYSHVSSKDGIVKASRRQSRSSVSNLIMIWSFVRQSCTTYWTWCPSQSSKISQRPFCSTCLKHGDAGRLTYRGRYQGCQPLLRTSFCDTSRARRTGGARKYLFTVPVAMYSWFLCSVAHYNRERIRRGATVDKAVVKKNLGRLTRESWHPSHNVAFPV